MVNIKYFVRIEYFRGWFGRWKKKTDKNIEELAESLLNIESGAEIIKQLRKEYKKCTRNQYLCGLGLALDCTIVPYLWYLAMKSDVISSAAPLAILLFAGGIGFSHAIMYLDKRKYLYKGLEDYINNKPPAAGTLDAAHEQDVYMRVKGTEI